MKNKLFEFLLMGRMLCCTCVCGIANFAGFPECDIRSLHRLFATASQTGEACKGSLF